MVGNAKAVLLIGDGLGDRPVKELGDLTPLEAADTPNLDRLAKLGECGIIDPIAPGIRPGSDTAHLALLGYDPYQTYTGRGPFEAAGIGMEVRGGDTCFRCNFSTVEDKFVVTDRRAGRIASGTDQLAAALNGLVINGVTCYFKESVEHRAALVLRGEGLGHRVSDADPHAEGQAVLEAQGEDEPSCKTATVINDFVRKSYELLKDHPVNQVRQAAGEHPANIVLPRGAGIAPHLEPFEQKYGFTGAIIVEVGLVKGLGKYLRMEVVGVPGATGGKDTDELALARAVVEALKTNRFVLCNLKMPDLGGHDDDVQVKMAAARKLDCMAEHIFSNGGADLYLLVTADHSTPVAVHDHSGDPVPALLVGPGVRTDAVDSFGERAAATGGMGRLRGSDVMSILTQFLGTQEKFGA